MQRPRGDSKFVVSEDQQAGKRGWKRVRGSMMRYGAAQEAEAKSGEALEATEEL